MRWESPTPNARGAHVGVFGLANGLAHRGVLSADDWTWWRASNDVGDAAYLDPATVDPTLFDKAVHPVTSCWFKTSAVHLLGHVPGYLALLDRYRVPWREVRPSDPGKVLYEDEVQVVVVPHASAEMPHSTIE